jgi:hypothetical protein
MPKITETTIFAFTPEQDSLKEIEIRTAYHNELGAVDYILDSFGECIFLSLDDLRTLRLACDKMIKKANSK